MHSTLFSTICFNFTLSQFQHIFFSFFKMMFFIVRLHNENLRTHKSSSSLFCIPAIENCSSFICIMPISFVNDYFLQVDCVMCPVGYRHRLLIGRARVKLVYSGRKTLIPISERMTFKCLSCFKNILNLFYSKFFSPYLGCHVQSVVPFITVSFAS